jgi:hypothetical protein
MTRRCSGNGELSDVAANVPVLPTDFSADNLSRKFSIYERGACEVVNIVVQIKKHLQAIHLP